MLVHAGRASNLCTSLCAALQHSLALLSPSTKPRSSVPGSHWKPRSSFPSLHSIVECSAKATKPENRQMLYRGVLDLWLPCSIKAKSCPGVSLDVEGLVDTSKGFPGRQGVFIGLFWGNREPVVLHTLHTQARLQGSPNNCYKVTFFVLLNISIPFTFHQN